MVPFSGTMGFFFSTIIRNGHGAAVVVILLALIAWFVQGNSIDNATAVVWTVFFNPFDMPDDTSQNRELLIEKLNKLAPTYKKIISVTGK